MNKRKPKIEEEVTPLEIDPAFAPKQRTARFQREAYVKRKVAMEFISVSSATTFYKLLNRGHFNQYRMPDGGIRYLLSELDKCMRQNRAG